MSVTPPEQIGSTLPISQTSTAVEISISDRIRTLAAQGLKVRDISSLLGVHPQVVLLLLDEGCTKVAQVEPLKQPGRGRGGR